MTMLIMPTIPVAGVGVMVAFPDFPLPGVFWPAPTLAQSTELLALGVLPGLRLVPLSELIYFHFGWSFRINGWFS